MGTVWTIIIVIHVCSLLFLAAYLKRLFAHVRRYRMPETQYTLLFGWIRLNHIVFVYVVIAIFFIAASIFFLSFAR